MPLVWTGERNVRGGKIYKFVETPKPKKRVVIHKQRKTPAGERLPDIRTTYVKTPTGQTIGKTIQTLRGGQWVTTTQEGLTEQQYKVQQESKLRETAEKVVQETRLKESIAVKKIKEQARLKRIKTEETFLRTSAERELLSQKIEQAKTKALEKFRRKTPIVPKISTDKYKEIIKRGNILIAISKQTKVGQSIEEKRYEAYLKEFSTLGEKKEELEKTRKTISGQTINEKAIKKFNLDVEAFNRQLGKIEKQFAPTIGKLKEYEKLGQFISKEYKQVGKPTARVPPQELGGIPTISEAQLADFFSPTAPQIMQQERAQMGLAEYYALRLKKGKEPTQKELEAILATPTASKKALGEYEKTAITIAFTGKAPAYAKLSLSKQLEITEKVRRAIEIYSEKVSKTPAGTIYEFTGVTPFLTEKGYEEPARYAGRVGRSASELAAFYSLGGVPGIAKGAFLGAGAQVTEEFVYSQTKDPLLSAAAGIGFVVVGSVSLSKAGKILSAKAIKTLEAAPKITGKEFTKITKGTKQISDYNVKQIFFGKTKGQVEIVQKFRQPVGVKETVLSKFLPEPRTLTVPFRTEYQLKLLKTVSPKIAPEYLITDKGILKMIYGKGKARKLAKALRGESIYEAVGKISFKGQQPITIKIGKAIKVSADRPIVWDVLKQGGKPTEYYAAWRDLISTKLYKGSPIKVLSGSEQQKMLRSYFDAYFNIYSKDLPKATLKGAKQIKVKVPINLLGIKRTKSVAQQLVEKAKEPISKLGKYGINIQKIKVEGIKTPTINLKAPKSLKEFVFKTKQLKSSYDYRMTKGLVDVIKPSKKTIEAEQFFKKFFVTPTIKTKQAGLEVYERLVGTPIKRRWASAIDPFERTVTKGTGFLAEFGGKAVGKFEQEIAKQNLFWKTKGIIQIIPKKEIVKKGITIGGVETKVLGKMQTAALKKFIIKSNIEVAKGAIATQKIVGKEIIKTGKELLVKPIPTKIDAIPGSAQWLGAMAGTKQISLLLGAEQIFDLEETQRFLPALKHSFIEAFRIEPIQKQKIGLMQATGQMQEKAIKQLSAQRIISKQAEKQLTKQLTKQAIKQVIISASAIMQAQPQAEIQVQKQLLRLRQVTRQKQVQKQVPRAWFFGQPLKPVTPPTWGLFRFPPLKGTEARRRRKGFVMAYQAEVKRKGIWVKVGRPAPAKLARYKGIMRVFKTPARTYRIVPTGRYVVGRVQAPSVKLPYARFFVPSKTVKGGFVEIPKVSIDLPGELKGITYKGLEAQKLKRLNPLLNFKSTNTKRGKVKKK